MAKTFAQRQWIAQQLMDKYKGWSVKVWAEKDLVEVFDPLNPAPGGAATLAGAGNQGWQVMSGDAAAALV
jgi:hypothetical protein